MNQPFEPGRLPRTGSATRTSITAPLYLLAPPPQEAVCCRCDDKIADPIAVNVPGLTARGWSHRACLPAWLLT